MVSLLPVVAVPRDASVYKRPNRPNWFVVYYCTTQLKRVHEATPFRVDEPTGYKRALAFAAAKSVAAIAFRGHAKREVWNAWVPRFIHERYTVSPLTLKRVANAWAWLDVYLTDKKVHVPAAVTYQHAVDYIPWRLTHQRPCGKRYSRNTAITELKFFGQIMQEAVRRDYAARNPCERLRLRRDPAREKPELTNAEIALIRAECARREGHLPIAEQWMTTSFEIALHTWCRLSSTAVPLPLVDFDRNEITLRTKGRKLGEPSYLTVPIHPDLLPRLHALRAAGAAHTCTLPAMAAKAWWALRQHLKIGHTCFHSTRVTGISRARRAGVPESFAMRLAGHNSPAVHRIYQREQASELQSHLEKVSYRPAPAAPPAPPDSATPQTPHAPPPI
jgi:hypothetical protein